MMPFGLSRTAVCQAVFSWPVLPSVLITSVFHPRRPSACSSCWACRTHGASPQEMYSRVFPLGIVLPTGVVIGGVAGRALLCFTMLSAHWIPAVTAALPWLDVVEPAGVAPWEPLPD